MATTGNRARCSRGRRPMAFSDHTRARLMSGRDRSSSDDSDRHTPRMMNVPPMGVNRIGTIANRARVMVPQNRLQRRLQQHNNRRSLSSSDEDMGGLAPIRRSQSTATTTRGAQALQPEVDLDDSRHEPGNETYMRDSFVVSDDDEDDIFSDSDRSLSNDSDDSSRPVFARYPPLRAHSEGDSSVDDDGDDDDDDSETSVLEPPSEPNDPSIIRSSEHGPCTICLEDSPFDPVGCLICRQLIGCRKCVDHWHRAGIKKKADNAQDANNHFQCPLCRHDWESQPEICSIFDLD